ncbi:MAG: SCP2 sterol-binding domain-containing protein [Candidatus Bathyarchaeia archaeon]
MEDKKALAENIMKEIQRRLNEVKELNAGWGKAVQQVFQDIGIAYRIKFAMDGTAEIEKKPASEIKLKDAEATVFCNVEDLQKILEGKLNAMEAMSSGVFKIEGSLDALLKLAPAIM